MTDHEIIVRLRDAGFVDDMPGSVHAARIITRQHFKRLYERNPTDYQKNQQAAVLIKDAVEKKYGPENIRFDNPSQKGESIDFPVLMKDLRVESSRSLSQALNQIPVVKTESVFIRRDFENDASQWLKGERSGIINLGEGR